MADELEEPVRAKRAGMKMSLDEKNTLGLERSGPKNRGIKTQKVEPEAPPFVFHYLVGCYLPMLSGTVTVTEASVQFPHASVTR
mgnify:CR=1 FL=1